MKTPQRFCVFTEATVRTRTPRRLLHLVLLALLLALMSAAPGARAAIDMFMEAGNIKGESKDQQFPQAIEVLAWSWGMSQSGTVGGAGAGKANFQDLSFTKYIDTATTPLMQNLALGSHIPEMKLNVRKAAQQPVIFLKITMKDVLVTSLSTGGSGGEDRLTENVTLNFGEVEVEYFTSDGKSAGVFKFNIVQNKVP
jgi:type VI secretion system secreted protein Hcp